MRSGRAGCSARNTTSVSRETSSQPPTTAAGRFAVQIEPVRPVEMDAPEQAFVDRDAIVDQAARDEHAAVRDIARLQLIGPGRCSSEPVTSSRTWPSRIVTLAWSLTGSIGDAVVVAEAFGLVLALRQLADLAIRPALGIGDQLVEERLDDGPRRNAP